MASCTKDLETMVALYVLGHAGYDSSRLYHSLDRWCLRFGVWGRQSFSVLIGKVSWPFGLLACLPGLCFSGWCMLFMPQDMKNMIERPGLRSPAMHGFI